ncbi:MAG: transcription elongation factor GreA [Deltaproteobacteria bacterium]|nr:transcription elongation factor GreA [Deltaproteobacteria bacterium]
MGEGKVPMTPEGHEAIKREIQRLKSEERPRIILAIEEARGHGDLSENAEYDAAKDRQGFIEAKLRDLEDKLARAEVIDPTRHKGDRVVFGATVHLEDMASGDRVTYRIVGEDEADLAIGKISVTSPVARALIGSEEGDEVTVRVPSGLRKLGILKVEYV